MKKQLLKERFQELAGIKPLYELTDPLIPHGDYVIRVRDIMDAIDLNYVLDTNGIKYRKVKDAWDEKANAYYSARKGNDQAKLDKSIAGLKHIETVWRNQAKKLKPRDTGEDKNLIAKTIEKFEALSKKLHR